MTRRSQPHHDSRINLSKTTTNQRLTAEQEQSEQAFIANVKRHIEEFKKKNSPVINAEYKKLDSPNRHIRITAASNIANQLLTHYGDHAAAFNILSCIVNNYYPLAGFYQQLIIIIATASYLELQKPDVINNLYLTMAQHQITLHASAQDNPMTPVRKRLLQDHAFSPSPSLPEFRQAFKQQPLQACMLLHTAVINHLPADMKYCHRLDRNWLSRFASQANFLQPKLMTAKHEKIDNYLKDFFQYADGAVNGFAQFHQDSSDITHQCRRLLHCMSIEYGHHGTFHHNWWRLLATYQRQLALAIEDQQHLQNTLPNWLKQLLQLAPAIATAIETHIKNRHEEKAAGQLASELFKLGKLLFPHYLPSKSQESKADLQAPCDFLNNFNSLPMVDFCFYLSFECVTDNGVDAGQALYNAYRYFADKHSDDQLATHLRNIVDALLIMRLPYDAEARSVFSEKLQHQDEAHNLGFETLKEKEKISWKALTTAAPENEVTARLIQLTRFMCQHNHFTQHTDLAMNLLLQHIATVDRNKFDTIMSIAGQSKIPKTRFTPRTKQLRNIEDKAITNYQHQQGVSSVAKNLAGYFAASGSDNDSNSDNTDSYPTTPKQPHRIKLFTKAAAGDTTGSADELTNVHLP